MPLIKEQKRIAEILTELNSEIEIHQAEANILDELFTKLLNSLMSGSIRVTDFDIDITCLESQGAAT